ncbi:hypothetical protein E2C01_064096 [Portunus trituberculatus]|uniref:Uncharacterized protein n=1 Tax=Portunus trituberculatus TaxID=210409 RepID=A0A5B7HMU2_PORTR|nr:hypothetical protein [Portunus trituberculatus]
MRPGLPLTGSLTLATTKTLSLFITKTRVCLGVGDKTLPAANVGSWRGLARVRQVRGPAQVTPSTYALPGWRKPSRHPCLSPPSARSHPEGGERRAEGGRPSNIHLCSLSYANEDEDLAGTVNQATAHSRPPLYFATRLHTPHYTFQYAVTLAHTLRHIPPDFRHFLTLSKHSHGSQNTHYTAQYTHYTLQHTLTEICIHSEIHFSIT